jgi:hypothetical protein
MSGRRYFDCNGLYQKLEIKMNGVSLPQGREVRYKSVLQGVQGPDFIYCSTGLVGQQSA